MGLSNQDHGHLPRNDELLMRERSQSETNKPYRIQIWSKFPSTSADFSGEIGDPGLRHRHCHTNFEAWK
jgi:hypothetical protein